MRNDLCERQNKPPVKPRRDVLRDRLGAKYQKDRQEQGSIRVIV